MTRSKNFSREDVLEKAMPLFWKKGFASTSMHDLETTTGVNKSGLYSEFKDKEDIYLASLAYYTLTSGRKEILEATPLGWSNIEKLFREVLNDRCQQDGCFMIFSMRDYALFSANGRKIISRQLDKMRSLVLQNVQSEKTKASAEQLTDIILMFFTGLTLAENSKVSTYSDESITAFLTGLKKL